MSLNNLRILDLTSGERAFCGQILEELGADVVSGTGLDLASEGGRCGLLDAVASRSILIESFPPGFLDSRGIGYEALSQLYQDLVMVSITDFGQTGPKRKWASAGLVTASLGGQVYCNGYPHKPPIKVYGDQAEFFGSLFAAAGVLLAVRHRAQMGCGSHVDISLQECVAASLDQVMGNYFSASTIWKRSGSLSLNGSVRVVRCLDGHAVVSLLGSFDTLLDMMMRGGFGRDLVGLDWSDLAYRASNVVRFGEVVEEWAATQSKHDLYETGQAMRLPWAIVMRPEEVSLNQQLVSRKFFVKGRNSAIGTRALPWIETRDHLSSSSQETDTGGVAPATVPLSGVRVLDLTWVLAGPFATRLMADFGAEVIKVQSRRIPGVDQDNLTPYFAQWNRGKLGVTLNLERPEARALFKRLVSISDVVIESYSRRVMANWGLDYAELRAVKPDIIMVSMSAFGHTGPWADRVSFGTTVQALSGMTFLTSYEEDEPVGPGPAFADHMAGLYGAIAALNALEHRRVTGFGQYVDLSQFEAACIAMRQPLAKYMNNGVASRPVGNHDTDGLSAPHNVYPCLGDDHWVAIVVCNDTEWKDLCRAMGDPMLAEDPRFASIGERVENQEELDAIIGRWTAHRSAGEVEAMLQAAGVRAGAVYDAAGLARDEQLLARNFFAVIDHPVLGRLTMDGMPVRMVGGPSWVSARPAPLPGQHNIDVFRGLLGLSAEELKKYEAEHVVF